MVEEPADISAQELISQAVFDRWPDIVPMNVVLIMDALAANNQRSLFVLNNTDCTPWVLQGMLNLVETDVRTSWAEQGWQTTELTFDDEGDDD